MDLFKERLKALREAKGLTQTQLSEKLNIGRTSVSNYELGLRTPDIDVLADMANFFNVTTDYLTGRSNYKTTKEEFQFEDFTSSLEDSLILVDEKFKGRITELLTDICKSLVRSYTIDTQLSLYMELTLNRLFQFYSEIAITLLKINENTLELDNDIEIKNLYDSLFLQGNSNATQCRYEITNTLTDVEIWSKTKLFGLLKPESYSKLMSYINTHSSIQNK